MMHHFSQVANFTALLSDGAVASPAAVIVHPLGGCAMDRSSTLGVADSDGRVFNVERALYIANGSLVPGRVGADPSFMIAAMADRVADAVVNDPWPF